ncbi:MAG: hypothetical protein JO076_04245 [Verrucomicrobia bacterium]|nr:hypothetical protein [Verrucomicrobiota bacterium]
MNVDLRYPLGFLFMVFGVILTLFGLFSDQAMNARSLSINVNLWWGLLMLLFGLLMYFFAWRTDRAERERIRRRP